MHSRSLKFTFSSFRQHFQKKWLFLVNCGNLSYVLILFSAASTELDDPRFVFVETMHVLKCVFFKKLHTLLGGHLNDALSTPYQNTNIYIAV